MVRNDIKKSSLLRTKILIYAFNGRTFLSTNRAPCRKKPILAKVCFDAKRGQSVNTIK